MPKSKVLGISEAPNLGHVVQDDEEALAAGLGKKKGRSPAIRNFVLVAVQQSYYRKGPPSSRT